LGAHRCGDGGVAIGLESVSDVIAGIEEALAAEDWDALQRIEAAQPEPMSADEQELCRLIAETDRLQRLIAGYMAQVHTQMDEAPQLRRAAAAYTRGAGTI
jgi:hypothetical protein